MSVCRRIALAAAALVATGCMSHHTVRFADVDPLGWEPSEPVTVSVNNRDTVGLRDIVLLVRFESAVTLDTLPLRISTRTPGGDIADESFTVCVGHTATASPGFIEAAAVYRTGALLRERGQYDFTFYLSGPRAAGISGIGVDLKPGGHNE